MNYLMTFELPLKVNNDGKKLLIKEGFNKSLNTEKREFKVIASNAEDAQSILDQMKAFYGNDAFGRPRGLSNKETTIVRFPRK